MRDDTFIRPAREPTRFPSLRDRVDEVVIGLVDERIHEFIQREIGVELTEVADKLESFGMTVYAQWIRHRVERGTYRR